KPGSRPRWNARAWSSTTSTMTREAMPCTSICPMALTTASADGKLPQFVSRFPKAKQIKPRHKNKSHQRRCAAANRPPRTGLHFDDHRADSIPLNPFPNGTPYLHNNLEQRWLTPRVQAMQIDEKGMGFHAFRRFRKTWLRGERCQEDINNFWMGHQPETMSELNSRMES